MVKTDNLVLRDRRMALDNFSILLLNFRDREETPLSFCYDKCLATTVDI